MGKEMELSVVALCFCWHLKESVLLYRDNLLPHNYIVISFEENITKWQLSPCHDSFCDQNQNFRQTWEKSWCFFSWENADMFVGSSHLKKKKKPQENLRPKHTRVRGHGSIPREILDCLDAVCSGRLECKSQPRLISGRQRASGCAAEGNFLTITLRAFLLLAN